MQMEEMKGMMMEETAMTAEERNKEVESICRWAAARAGVLAMAPKFSTTALIANDTYMVTRIAQAYGHSLTSGAIVGFLGALGGSVVTALLTSLLKNPKVKIPVAVCMSYAIGKVAEKWIGDGMPMPADFSEYQDRLAQIFDHIKTTVESLMSNPMKDTPLGDERRDMLGEAGVKSDEFLGLNVNSLTDMVGSTIGAVAGLFSGRSGLAALISQLGDSATAFGNTKHALRGIGALLLSISESAAYFVNSATVSSITAAKSVVFDAAGKVGLKKED